MPAPPAPGDPLHGLASKTARNVDTAVAALRKALARLLAGGWHQGRERPTR